MWKKADEGIKKITGGNPDSVMSLSFAFLFKQIFNSLSPPEELDFVDHTPDEVRTLYYCCFLSKMIYVAPEDRKPPKCLSNIVFESNESDMYIIPYNVVNSDKLNTIFVTFRGSYCFKDFLTDIKAGVQQFPGGQIHKGVYLTAKNLYSKVIPLILKLSNENNHRPIIFTGHSLGAGVSAAICEHFYQEHPDYESRCVIFAPISSFCEKLWIQTAPRCRSYVTDGDFVPFLSFYNVKELPPEVIPSVLKKYIDQEIQKRIGLNIYSPKLVPPDVNPFEQPPPPIDSIYDDSIDKYIGPVPLYPPGDCYMICLLEENTSNIKLKKVKDYRYFGRFNNNLNEFRHMMGFYKEWVEKYVENYFKEHPSEKL